jgi:hypothetical protein
MEDETYYIDGYKVEIQIDFEEDNQKAYVEVTPSDGNRHLLDITPYWPSSELIEQMVRFHEKYGYFLTRQDIESSGSVVIEDIKKVKGQLAKELD